MYQLYEIFPAAPASCHNVSSV